MIFSFKRTLNLQSIVEVWYNKKTEKDDRQWITKE